MGWRSNMRYTMEELEQIRRMTLGGKTIHEIAVSIGREDYATERAIIERCKMSPNRVKWRKKQNEMH